MLAELTQKPLENCLDNGYIFHLNFHLKSHPHNLEAFIPLRSMNGYYPFANQGPG